MGNLNNYLLELRQKTKRIVDTRYGLNPRTGEQIVVRAEAGIPQRRIDNILDVLNVCRFEGPSQQYMEYSKDWDTGECVRIRGICENTPVIQYGFTISDSHDGPLNILLDCANAGDLVICAHEDCDEAVFIDVEPSSDEREHWKRTRTVNDAQSLRLWLDDVPRWPDEF